MEQFFSVPFSAVIATLLLTNRVVTAREIVNFESKISLEYDIYVEEDDISFFSVCVDVDEKFNFKLKSYLFYDSVLESGITVRQFLLEHSLSVKNFPIINHCDVDFVCDTMNNCGVEKSFSLIHSKRKMKILNFIKEFNKMVF